MSDDVAEHYSGSHDLVARIAAALREAGKDPAALTTADLRAVDEFHIRGHQATLEIGQHLRLTPSSRMIDIGSGLGGPARSIAEAHGCHVTGIDLTPAFCEAATELSRWVGLADKVAFRQGDATALTFPAASFDAAMTIHVAMNIAAKDRMYAQARRVLKPGARFVVYDVLQGEGGAVIFPVPWARDPSISHLATRETMPILLAEAGFRILSTEDSTEASQRWFEAMATRLARSPPAVSFRAFLGDDFPVMARNQVTNLRERRIRTVTYVCEA